MNFRNVKISEAMNLVEQLLKDAVALLPDKEKVKVHQPATIENYRLDHQRGALLIIPGKGLLDNEDMANAIIQKHNMMIYVYAVVNYIESRNHPSDYIDFILDTLTGKEIVPEEGSRRGDRQIYCTDWTLIKEERGEWWFLVGAVLPYSRFEQEFINNQ
jgi:hypothetical protein